MQLWTNQKDFEGIRDGKGFNDGNNFFGRIFDGEDGGHSVFFLSYSKNWLTGKINGINVVDQYGKKKINRRGSHYKVFFGANFIDLPNLKKK